MSHYSNLVEDLKKEYPKAMEEVEKYLPRPLIDELEITVFVDSDHAQNTSAIAPPYQISPAPLFSKAQNAIY